MAQLVTPDEDSQLLFLNGFGDGGQICTKPVGGTVVVTNAQPSATVVTKSQRSRTVVVTGKKPCG